MHTIVIGDLHGKLEIAQHFLAQPARVVFVGDFVDSFDRSRASQYELLDTVLTACEEEPTRVYACMGNHELSYLSQDHRCSGFSNSFYARLLGPMQRRMRGYLRRYVSIDNILITHAGVSNRWLSAVFPDFVVGDDLDLTLLESFLFECPSELYNAIGYARGGSRYGVGGPAWCDWYDEFEPVPGLKQIMGHTARRTTSDPAGVIERDNCWNIDCLDRVNQVVSISAGHVALVSF